MSRRKRDRAREEERRKQEMWEAEKNRTGQLLLRHAEGLALEMNLRLLEEWDVTAEAGADTVLWVDSFTITGITYARRPMNTEKKAKTAGGWIKALWARIRRWIKVIGLLQ